MTSLLDKKTVPVLDEHTAVRVAADLGAWFAQGAVERDRERILPVAEYDALARSGLLAITVPREFGGPDLPVEVVTEVFRLIAAGDPSIAQLPHSHFVYVNALRHRGDDALQRLLFGEVLAGARFGNAQAEVGTKTARTYRTTLTPDGSGNWHLDGEKAYCTGAMFAEWIPVLAHRGVDGPMYVAWVRRDADGVGVSDDWDGMGQRTTASGRVTLEHVAVDDAMVMPYHLTFEQPQTYGSFAQVLHAAIDAGIARAALDDAVRFVTTRSRPHPDSGAETAAGDPLTVQTFGEMSLSLRAAEALLAEGARAVDRANRDLTAESAAAASLAVAAARASTSRVSVQLASQLFEVSGTSAVHESLDLDRHWRNARTHTLHDAVSWKLQHLGRHTLLGVLPPNHAQI